MTCDDVCPREFLECMSDDIHCAKDPSHVNNPADDMLHQAGNRYWPVKKNREWPLGVG